MRHLKPALAALALGFFAASSALAADCCKDKGKPCCEEKDGKRAACCDKHKETGKPADAPKPAEQPHQHNH